MRIHQLEIDKTKLTKSFVNQMHVTSSYEIMKCGEIHGYVLNVHKQITKAAIISFNHKNYVIALDYVKSDPPYRKLFSSGKPWISTLRTPIIAGINGAEISATEWWLMYLRMKSIAEQTHIYVR